MTTGTKTMLERVRDPGHGFIIGFPTTNTERRTGDGTFNLDTLEAYFFRVAKSQRFYYEYDQLGSFTDGETRDFDYLGSGGLGSGDDILRVGEDDFHVYHFGFAPESPDLNVYTAVNPSSSSDKALARRGRDIGPQPGDPSGFFNTRRADSAYDPPAETERVSFRNDKDGEFLEFAFEATDDIAAGNDTLYLTGRGYKLLPVTDTETQEKMVEVVAGNNIEDSSLPTIITQVGGLGDYELGTERPDNWTDAFSRRLDYTKVGVSGRSTSPGQSTRR